jgi:hypothetical protein
VSEVEEEATGRGGHDSGLCARCGEQPASVIDGALTLCGSCYHSEVLRQRRRAVTQRITGNASLDLIRSIERSIWKQITDCKCVND